MKHKLKARLKTMLELRKPTLEGDKYTIKNPLEFIVKSKGLVKLSDGYQVPYNKENKEDLIALIIFALRNGIRFGDKEDQWKLDPTNQVVETHQGIKFNLHKAGLLGETFLYQVHFSGFNLNNKIVVTAGAYIGDTPLFYSKYGAKVYGFEPDPTSYDLALKNLSLNPELSKNIIIKNYAVGKDEDIEFTVNSDDPAGSSIYANKGNEIIRIKSKSISRILREFNILDPYLLDLDIKGSEFDVIEDSSIKNFQKVRIEYSPYLFKSEEKTLESLINKLKSYGFNNIRVYKHNAIRVDLLNHGTLEAEK